MFDFSKFDDAALWGLLSDIAGMKTMQDKALWSCDNMRFVFWHEIYREITKEIDSRLSNAE